MEGVIVHTEHVYREMSVSAVVLLLAITICGLSVIAFMTIRSFKKKDGKRWEVAMILAILTLFFGAADIWAVNSMFTIHTNKIVTIDDTVCFNEFFDRYEIVDQDGKLYTVRELPIEEIESEDAGDNE